MKAKITRIDNCFVLQKQTDKERLYNDLITFVNHDLKLLEMACDSEIMAILRKKGITITTKNMEKALDDLRAIYCEKIDIVDCHAITTEQIVYRTSGANVIFYDNLLEIAVEVKVVDYYGEKR